MTPDELETAKAVSAAWAAFKKASSVTELAASYRELAMAVSSLDQYLRVQDKRTPDDFENDDEFTYWVQLFNPEKREWFTPGCGYDYNNPAAAITTARDQVNDGELARVTFESRTTRVIWNAWTGDDDTE